MRLNLLNTVAFSEGKMWLDKSNTSVLHSVYSVASCNFLTILQATVDAMFSLAHLTGLHLLCYSSDRELKSFTCITRYDRIDGTVLHINIENTDTHIHSERVVCCTLMSHLSRYVKTY